MDYQHLARWRGLGSTQRQARELISCTSPAAKTRISSVSRTQSRVVTGLFSGPNALRRSLHLMRLTNSSLCRRCGAEAETSAHVLCECEALASLRHAYLGPFPLDPDDVRSLSLGAFWNSSKRTGLP
jgi:ribosomal protein L40E